MSTGTPKKTMTAIVPRSHFVDVCISTPYTGGLLGARAGCAFNATRGVSYAVCMKTAMRAVKGMKAKEMYGEISKPSEVIFPNVSIPLTVIPEAKDWKVGKTYEITLRLKQTGMHMNKAASGDRGAAQFDIVGVAPHGEATKTKAAKKKTAPVKKYSRLPKERAG